MRKLYRILATAACSLLLVNSSWAQQYNVGGAALNNDIVTWGDMYNLSFTTHNYGTARSMAMGNAFTALGADMISASLNPAGIGMYINSDVSFTPMMQFAKSSVPGTDPFNTNDFSDKSDRFGLASAGGVFTAYRGTGALTNMNIGFVYNRIADFNQNMKFASWGNSNQNSMANLFCSLSNADGLITDADGRMSWGNDPYYWGPVLAYKNGLTNKDDMGWYIDRIGENAEIDQYTALETRGSIGEYDFTFGFNFIDKFYFGFTLGVQDVNYRRTLYYGENYIYPNDNYPSGDYMPYQLEYMNYQQSTRISGAGVNFKLGFVWRPVSWLRVGAAYHTPTAYNLSLQYYADMWSRTFSAGTNPDGYDISYDGYMSDYVESPAWEDEGENAWRISSPSRVMVGAAVTVAQRLIISADYEASFYNKTKLRGAPIVNLDYTATMNAYFKNSNTVRLGAEFRLLPAMDIRAGYIWSGAALRSPNEIYSRPLIKSQSYITAGIGFRLGQGVNLDLAYQYNNNKYSCFQSFYGTGSLKEWENAESVPVTSSMKRHIAVLTVGFRF
ncbi:MAG: outer membrane protein transport protein [Alistipes sp.]|nr:outer membrane protein transport protein [Alistipes sp.]